VLTSGGHGFAAIKPPAAAGDPAARCEEFGVTIHYREPAPALEVLRLQHDLVVGADGVNSITRQSRQDVFQPELDMRHARYMWLGTPLVFDAFKFFIAETDCGVVQSFQATAHEEFQLAALDQLSSWSDYDCSSRRCRDMRAPGRRRSRSRR